MKKIKPTSVFFEGKVSTFHLPGVENDKGLLIPLEFQLLHFQPVRTHFDSPEEQVLQEVWIK